jgi:PAS domain S-box-containing protein
MMDKVSSLLAGSAGVQADGKSARAAAIAAAPATVGSSSRGDGASAFGSSATFRVVVRGLVFATLYFAAMVGAIQLARFGGHVAPIWIASPVFAWALLTAPYRDWPALTGFIAIAHVLGGVLVGDQAAMEAVYLLANIVSPIVCTALLLRRGNGLEFEDRRSVFRFLLICIVSATASSAIVGSWTLISAGQVNLRDTGMWFLSDGLSFVVFLPIFKSLAYGGWRELLAPNVRTRAIVLFSILIIAPASHWFTPEGFRRVFPTLLVPYLIYMVFELGITGARATLAITTVSFLVYALFASEMARRGMPPVDYLFSVQVYIATIVACLLPLAAALAEKQKLYETASEALSDAQAAWGDLIAAEAHYRLLADNAEDMILRLSLDGGVMFASPACRTLCADVEALTGRKLADLAHADDAARAREQLSAFASKSVLDKPNTMRLRLARADGTVHAFDVRVTLVASRGKVADEFIAVLRQVQQ